MQIVVLLGCVDDENFKGILKTARTAVLRLNHNTEYLRGEYSAWERS